MAEEQLTPERAVRLLRAKAAQLETWVEPRLGAPGTTELDWLVADVALIADLLATHIERSDAHSVLYEAHTENLIERVYALEGGDEQL